IVLLGLQLSLQDIAGLGAGMIVVVVVIVTVGLLATLWIGSLLGLSWTQRLLIACGFSICGAAAVAAADAVVEAEEEEVASSIALVVVFGTAMIAIIPILATLLGLDDRTAGLWAGGSIHEVAQVVAAAGAIGGGALSVAVIVKLARVLMLAPVMAAISIWQRYRTTASPKAGARPPLIPLFVLGFLFMVLIASGFDIPTQVSTTAKYLQTALLSAAMFALGCGVRRDALKAVGVKPVALAGAATGVVMVVSLVGVLLVG
ncbi:MAG TPA: putative sulfate exporter family transporter, partial [Marmoricola sp.]|nr:putative sulfate exporter family transporter [Marmoricola sp.]